MTKKRNSCLLQFFASIVGGIIFWYIMKYIFLWVPNLADILTHIQTPLKESSTWRIIGLLTTIVIAITLYNLKKNMSIIFGLIEVSGGGWTIWITFSQNFENNVIYALALAGGIFLLINGFGNIMINELKSKNENNKDLNNKKVL